MNTTLRRIRPHCVVLVLLFALLSISLLAAEVKPAAKVAPNFTLTNVKTGKPVSLCDFKGKVVVIDAAEYSSVKEGLK